MRWPRRGPGFDGPPPGGAPTRPLLIDTDPGIDDALALLFVWGSPEVEVEALTTVSGNVPVTTATMNVFRLLALRRLPRVPPVAVGASEPLGRPLVTATHYHGEDGLGDLPDWPDVVAKPVPAAAADVVVEAARRHGERLTILALGPLTNLALALRRDARAIGSVGRVVVMGGAVDVPGNVTPTAEFNIHVDPEAAAEVLAAGLPLDLVPLDATRQAVLSRQALEAALVHAPPAVAERVAALTRHAFRAENDRATAGMVLHDPLAAAVAIDGDLVEWERVRVTIGAGGETRRAAGAPNCRFARRVDTARFLATFLDRLCRG